MSTTITAKLLCPECRRENEPERIYCHECGARLDRSAVIKQKAKEDDPQATQRRLHSMFDPRRAKLRRNFFLVSKVILGAVLLAGIVQMVRSPDLPSAKDGMGEIPAQINLDLENAAMDPRLGPLRYSEEQVNAYLAYTLKGKQAALSKYYLNFDRLVVAFGEDACRATVQRSLFGVPLCTTINFTPQLQNGTLTAKSHGGAIGRLAVHPLLLQYSDFLFADVRAALERERKPLVKLGGIELHPKAVVITPRVPHT
jgi:hypothetical protein